MARRPAKFKEYRGYIVRVDREGHFTVDGVTGKWDQFAKATAAIDAALSEEVSIPCLIGSGNYRDGEVVDLIPATFVGVDKAGRLRVRYDRQEGDGFDPKLVHLEYRGEVFPDTDEVRARWAEYRRLRKEEHEAYNKANAIQESMPLLRPEDET